MENEGLKHQEVVSEKRTRSNTDKEQAQKFVVLKPPAASTGKTVQVAQC